MARSFLLLPGLRRAPVRPAGAMEFISLNTTLAKVYAMMLINIHHGRAKAVPAS
jgi:hypothetical protein